MAKVLDLVAQTDCSVERVLPTMYSLLRADPARHASTILNPGCTVDELDQAERRVGVSLPPLHRLLLGLSNGGSLPYLNSIQFMAAALLREQVWNWLQNPPRMITPSSVDDAGAGPFKPLVLGKSLLEVGYSSRQAERLQLGEFIVIASGYDGMFYGYRRSSMDAVEYVTPDLEHGQKWPSFRDFILDQRLDSSASTSRFAEQVRAECWS